MQTRKLDNDEVVGTPTLPREGKAQDMIIPLTSQSCSTCGHNRSWHIEDGPCQFTSETGIKCRVHCCQYSENGKAQDVDLPERFGELPERARPSIFDGQPPLTEEDKKGFDPETIKELQGICVEDIPFDPKANVSAIPSPNRNYRGEWVNPFIPEPDIFHGRAEIAQDTLAEIFEPTIPMSVEYFVNERMGSAIKQLDQEIVADFGAAMRADFEGSPSRTYDGILRIEESKDGVEAGGAAGKDRRTVEAVSKGDDGVESGAVGVGEQKGVDG
jgi:hypothetical protein